MHLSEYHDVIFALHGVLDTVVAFGEHHTADLDGVTERDLLNIRDSVLIQRSEAKNREANHHQRHDGQQFDCAHNPFLL